MPVPAGIRRPMMTFSLRPRRWSTLPFMAASVSTRLVSWKLAEQYGLSGRRTPAGFLLSLILGAEAKLVDDFFRQKFGIADIFHLHPAHHLARDDFQVLVVDVDALQTVDFLNLVHQVLLQFLFAEHAHDVVRIARAVHERIARVNTLAFLDVDVNAAGESVLALLAVVADDVQFAHALRDFAVLHRSVYLADHGGFARLAGFEQLHHARQAARDVLGLGGG